MNRQFKLLVENLFDDLYDIDQETNSDIDLADEVYQYHIGDFYYKRKSPYAVCCGTRNDFKDNEPRFVSIKYEEHQKIGNSFSFFINKKFKYNKITSAIVKNNNIVRIDENGYENTQVLIKKDVVYKYPGFIVITKKNKDLYFPAIDELQVMMFNINKINEAILSQNKCLPISETETDKAWDVYWSSTQSNDKEYFLSIIFAENCNKLNIYEEYITTHNIIRPFVKI